MVKKPFKDIFYWGVRWGEGLKLTNHESSKHYTNFLSKLLGCGPGFFSSATKYFLTFDRRQHSTKGFRPNCDWETPGLKV